MTYGAPIDLDPPLVLDEDTWRGPRYAQRLVDLAALIVERVEKRVTVAGLDIRAEVALPDVLEGVSALRWKNQAAIPDTSVYPWALYVFDQDLHVTDGAGSSVRITRGGTIDLSSVGGINGEGYGEGGVEIRWAGGGLYELKSQPAAFADLEVDDLKIAYDATHFIRLSAVPMAGDYGWALPPAISAAKAGLYVGAGGDLGFSATPRHGEMSLLMGASGGYGDGLLVPEALDDYAVRQTAAGSWDHKVPLPLSAGDRLKSVTLYLDKSSGAALTAKLQRMATAAAVDIDSWTVTPAGAQAAAHVLASPYTVTDSESVSLYLAGPGAADVYFGAKVVYDRP